MVSNDTPSYAADTSVAPKPTSLLTLFIFAAAFLWLEALALGSIIPHWVHDLSQINGAEGNPTLVPLGAVIFGGLMGLPFLFLWNWRDSERYRAVFQTWGLGTLFFILMIPLRLVPQTQVLGANLLQIIIALLFAWGLRRRYRPVDYPGMGRIGLLPALLFALPWLWFHSFGSILDTVMNLLAGLAFGAAVAAILQSVLLPVLNRTGTAGWNIALGGFVTGVLLNVMVVGLRF